MCGYVFCLEKTLRGRSYAAFLKRKYGSQVGILFGDIRNYEDCLNLTKGADYLIHLAAVIPPKSDHDAKMTMETNYDGTCHLIDAVLEQGNKTKVIYISTVAIYGNRNMNHPWGRVGDPLMTSAFDVYGLSKTMAEHYVLEAGLRHWVVLRQTGILYDNILMNNISDGLMFHTPWNVPIEWVTAKDSGILIANIIKRDLKKEITDFWKNVYNIGGGASARETGYETFDAGFKLIGGSVKSFFKPNWNLPRNFHCFWFNDSDVLEDLFHFRTQGCDDFWQWFSSRHKIYAAGKIVPAPILKKLVIEPLLKNSNAPIFWLKHGDNVRVQAFFGGEEAYQKLPTEWEQTELICEKEDYDKLKQHDPHMDLDHGYDESKPDTMLSLEDMKKAAEFRGGECISENMIIGDLQTKLLWRCYAGHTFESSPFTILKAGHWCPECCLQSNRWAMDEIAKHSPFHAQVWNDSHSPNESYIYTLKEGKAEMLKL